MNRPAVDLESTAPCFPPIEDYVDGAYLPLLQSLKDLSFARGEAVYLVGGPVRDRLLGLPVKDLDFVVEGNAPALARDLAGQIGGRAVVHGRFGTATVSLNEVKLDLVTARREVYPVPGALPEVEPASLDEDLVRRDFSINAMALPLGGDSTLYDPLGGRVDLHDGLIRSLHSGSFRDDPTRLFRAVRYERRLGFRLERETEIQLLAAVRAKVGEGVSGDRFRHELARIFEEEFPAKALVRAVELGVLPHLHPALRRTDILERWAAVREEADRSGEAGPLAWLAALAYPLPAGDGESLAHRLNMPAAWARVVRDAIKVRQLEYSLAGQDLAPSEGYRLLEGISLETLYLGAGVADLPGTAGNLASYLTTWRHVRPFLGGQDLLDLGVPAGPLVGRVLDDLHRAVLDRQVTGEDEERQWVRDFLAAEGRGITAS